MVGLSLPGLMLGLASGVGGRPPFNPPQTGDLVFGAQGLAGIPTFSGSTGGLTVTSGYENMLLEGYLPSQPVNWRMIYANFYGQSSGQAPIERAVVSDRAIAWGSLFAGLVGTGFIADVPFTEYGASLAQGGFTMSDALPAVSDGAILRMVVTQPLNGRRISGRHNTPKNGTLNRKSATIATLNTCRVSGAVSGGGLFNNESEALPAGYIQPKSSGYRSFLLNGTSIERGQNADFVNLAADRDAYGYIPAGLDSATGGRMGWAQFAVYGASIANMDQAVTGEMSARLAILDTIKAKNGGHDAFTDIILGFRNDAVNQTGTDANDTLQKMLDVTRAGISNIKSLFPGAPIHVIDLPPIAATTFSPWYCTDTANQVAAVGEYRPAAVLLYNAYLAANFAAMGIASVIPAGSAACAPDDGSGKAKWRVSAFNLSGGGTLGADLAIGVNLATTGVSVTASQAPELGDYLIFEAGAGNVEAFISPIVSVTGAGPYTVKIASGTTTKLHTSGTTVKTCKTQDGTHPSHALHQNEMAAAVIAWKQTL